MSAVAPVAHARHALHDLARAWPETNCYTDLWVELLHARGFDPTAMLAYTVGVDWEGDQWTFVKPSAADLWALYGVEVRELNVWRDLPTHLVEHVGRGRVALVEVDAYHLPDTLGITYGTGHAKTTIGVDVIDPIARTLAYFHNAGRFELSGDDYEGVFGANAATRSDLLPPYTELALFERSVVRSPDALRGIAWGQLADHTTRLPHDNPVRAFSDRFGADVSWLTGQDLDAFHRYAFATLRQCGAAWELAGSFVAWLGGPVADAAPHFETLTNGARAIQMRLARVAHARRPIDVRQTFAEMGDAWDASATILRSACP